MKPQNPPPGCQVLPGFIVEVNTLLVPAWLRHDGTVTVDWTQRGIWPTAKAAQGARRRFRK